MSEYAFTPEEVRAKIGSDAFKAWQKLEKWLAENYDMEISWGSGGAKWEREKKYRKGGKTLCCFYPAADFFGFMVVFGKDERAAFEAQRASFSPAAVQYYDVAATYHDGKWVMLKLRDSSLVEDAKKLALIKRRPNRKG